jgi:peptide/nickel transport system permease protein
MEKIYFIKRIISTIIIFIAILHLQFLLFWVVNPIEPVQWTTDPDFGPDLAAKIRELYGLDQPVSVQYVKYITNMLTLNFGFSFTTRWPVLTLLWEYLPNTLILVLTAVLLQIVVGITIGLYAGIKHGKIVDLMTTGIGLLAYAMPPFLVFLTFRYIFAEKLRWFPIIGTIASPPTSPILYVGEFLYRMALPLVTLVIVGFGSWAFYTRSLSIEALSEDFMQTAKAKGVRGRKLMFKHLFYAILPPIITLIAISLPATIFGSVVTEYIFTWKGVGWWFLTSLFAGDYPVLQALFFVYTLLLLIGNFLTDVLYGYLDPRIRVGIRR